jgi:hypothetical protein
MEEEREESWTSLGRCAQARAGGAVDRVPLAGLGLKDDCWAGLFCAERCGTDAMGAVLASKAVVELLATFGTTRSEALAELSRLAQSQWFVSGPAFCRVARCNVEVDEPAHSCNKLFGICFRDSEQAFVLLQSTCGGGFVAKPLQERKVNQLAAVARTMQDQGFLLREDCRWAYCLPSCALQMGVQWEGRDAVHHWTASSISKPSQSIPIPPIDQLQSVLSGFSHGFASEVSLLFPSAECVAWTELLQWTLQVSHNTTQQSTEHRHNNTATSSSSSASASSIIIHLTACVEQLPTRTVFERDERNRILGVLTTMFVETGMDYARLLIEESFLPDPERSSVRHQRHGKYYRKGNQLFALACDVQNTHATDTPTAESWLYGGCVRDDRAAMKGAGHEIKVAQALMDSGLTHLNFPLMAAFTLRGRRVLCTSVLPIDDTATLVQGTGALDPELGPVMATMMGACLCIGELKGVYGPSDMRVHRGTDGLLYVIGAARLFPPECRSSEAQPGPKRMYQLLRPELLRKAGKLLASDGLGALCGGGDDKARAELMEVSTTLSSEIQQLAAELEAGQHLDHVATRADLKALIHARGLNMRHLEEVLPLMAVECAARQKVATLKARQVPTNVMHVKTLRHPRLPSASEAQQTLTRQRALLQEGPEVMSIDICFTLSSYGPL